MKTPPTKYATGLTAALVLALGLYGCGGGGGSSGGTDGGGTTMPQPEAVDLVSNVTPGFMAGPGTVTVSAGQSVVHGDIEFTCAAGGRDCTVTVTVANDGTITATSTGGTVTAMNSADYQNAVTPMSVDLAGVTAGFAADAGTVTIRAGQSEEHGDITFSCAAGGRDCEVTVTVDASGAVTATSTGGTVTAMNAPGYYGYGLEASPLTSPMASSAADSLESLDDASTAFAPVSAPLRFTVDDMGQVGLVLLERDEEAYVESITADGAGGYSVVYVVDGEKTQVNFADTDFVSTPGEFSYYQKIVGSAEYVFAQTPIYAGDRAPKQVYRRYFQLFHWRSVEPDTGVLQAFAAHGAVTASQSLVNLGSATYEGHLLAERHNNFTDPDFRAAREQLWAELTLNADFSAGTVSGSTGSMWLQLPGGTWVQVPDTNMIAFSDGEIDGSRFHAEWEGQDTNAGSPIEESLRGFEGAILGEFYGPGGEEVGGVLAGERAATNQVINGRFGAESQASAAAREAIQTAAGRDDGISASQDPAVYADSFSDTLANLLPYGTTAFAPLSAAVHRDWNNYETARPGQGDAFVKSISSDGANGFNVTYVVHGRDSVVHFSSDDWYEPWDSFRENKRGETDVWYFNLYWHWSFTGSFYDDPNDRTSGSSEFDYFDINGWGVSLPGDTYQGMSVYGVRTRPENMPRGSATYSGRMRGNTWQGDDPWSEAQVSGNLALNADFDNSGIDGQIDGLWTNTYGSDSPSEPMAAGNTIDISNGVIADGRFTADWVGNDTNANSALEDSMRGFAGTMTGEFYGPSAEEVGGVMGGHRAAVSGTPDVNLIGGFGAIRDDVVRPAGQ